MASHSGSSSTDKSTSPSHRDESTSYDHSQSDSKGRGSMIQPWQPRKKSLEPSTSPDTEALDLSSIESPEFVVRSSRLLADAGIGAMITALKEQFRQYKDLVTDTQPPASTMDDRRRLDVQHELLKKVLEGNYIAHETVQGILAPRDGPTPGILDIGTGTGAWAIAMAKEFPHAEVVGIDLVIPEVLEEKPPNCRFEVDDVNQPLPHYANCFDVVHCRLVDSGILDYPKFLNQVAQMLRPGGVILLVKAFHQLYNHSAQPLPVNEEGEPGFTFMQRMFTAAGQAIKKRGGSNDAALQYEYWFSQNPNYEPHQTVVRDLFIPIGRWSDALDTRSADICEMMRLNFRILIHAFKPLLLIDGYPEAQVDRWTSEAERELNTLSVKGYSKWRFAWALRSKKPWVPFTMSST